MFDVMLIAHHAHWRGATHCFIADDAAEPIVWVDPQRRLVVWHPALSRQVVIPDVLVDDAAQFASIVQALRPQLRRVVARCIEVLDVPRDYYAQLPEIARKLRVGDTPWEHRIVDDDGAV